MEIHLNFKKTIVTRIWYLLVMVITLTPCVVFAEEQSKHETIEENDLLDWWNRAHENIDNALQKGGGADLASMMPQEYPSSLLMSPYDVETKNMYYVLPDIHKNFRKDFSKKLNVNNFMGVKPYFKTEEAYKAFWMTALIIRNYLLLKDPHFIDWATNRSQKPPALLDVYLFAEFDIADFFKNKDGIEYVRNNVESWELLLRSKNPIYRLLALRVVQYFQDSNAKIRIYKKSLVNEQEPIFHELALNGLKRLGTEDAQRVVSEYLIRLNKSPRDNAGLIENAKKAAAAIGAQIEIERREHQKYMYAVLTRVGLVLPFAIILVFLLVRKYRAKCSDSKCRAE